jgi:hypothetical protein
VTRWRCLVSKHATRVAAQLGDLGDADELRERLELVAAKRAA